MAKKAAKPTGRPPQRPGELPYVVFYSWWTARPQVLLSDWTEYATKSDATLDARQRLADRAIQYEDVIVAKKMKWE